MINKPKQPITLGQFAELIRFYGASVNHFYSHDAVKRMYTGYLCGQLTCVAEKAMQHGHALLAAFEYDRQFLAAADKIYRVKAAAQKGAAV